MTRLPRTTDAISRLKRFWPVCWCGVCLLLFAGCQPSAIQLLRSPGVAVPVSEHTWVRALRPKPQSGRVLVIDRQGHPTYLPADSVWGYRTDRGRTYRLCEGDDYEVIQQAGLTLYRNEEWIGDARWDTYYFSLTPDSRPYRISRRSCRQVFAQDGCMTALLGQMSASQLLATNSHGSYGLVNAYTQCHPDKEQALGAGPKSDQLPNKSRSEPAPHR